MIGRRVCARGDDQRSHEAAGKISGLTGDDGRQEHDAREAETISIEDYTNRDRKRRQDRGHEYKDSEIETRRSTRGEKDCN
jgi:hypothetical protein